MLEIQGLLSRGYFPRELPPTFSTRIFSQVIKSNQHILPSTFDDINKVSKIAEHNLARAGTLRRVLGIPNPINYYNLCKLIIKDWKTLVTHINKTDFSKSKPKLGPTAGRSLVPYSLQSDLVFKKAHIRSSSRYILQADISQFYHNIYTHSIPWAIHTKPWSKIPENRNDKVIGNLLDKCIRNGQDGQTKGIPIGPDTSLLIAEIILTEADKDLLEKIPDINGFRYIDDYEIAFNSLSEAESALAVLQEIIYNYELSLNPQKTKILDLPRELEKQWVHELRTFQFGDTPESQAKFILAYFDKAFELVRENPNDHVLKYALGRLKGISIGEKNWDLAQDLFLQSVIVEPGTFIIVLSELIKYSEKNFQITLDALGKVLNMQIKYHAPIGHGSEVAWAIWGAMKFGVEIEKSSAEVISKMNDSVIALLSLDAQYRGLIPNGLDTSNWQGYMTKEDLYNEQWLLSYEANVKGWLPSHGVSDHVSEDKNFEFLKRNKVEFYDIQGVQNATPTYAPPSKGTAPIFSL